MPSFAVNAKTGIRAVGLRIAAVAIKRFRRCRRLIDIGLVGSVGRRRMRGWFVMGDCLSAMALRVAIWSLGCGGRSTVARGCHCDASKGHSCHGLQRLLSGVWSMLVDKTQVRVSTCGMNPRVLATAIAATFVAYVAVMFMFVMLGDYARSAL